MMRWPDVNKLGVTYLSATLAGVYVSTRIPADLADNLPLVRVLRGPGDDDRVTDAPLLDTEAFAATEGGAWTLAEDVRQTMHALTGQAVNGALVDSVTTSAAPTYLDYGNPAAWRVVASYRLNLRKR